MSDEELNTKAKSKLDEYAEKHKHHLKDYSYEIRNNGTEIVLKGKTNLNDIKDSAEDIKFLEEILDAKFQNYMILNEYHEVIFKRNKKD